MAVLDSKTYKTIEWRLYSYHRLRRQVAEYAARRAAITNSGRVQHTGGRHSISYRADPTATKAIDLAELAAEHREAAAWVDIIERVIHKYADSPKGTLLQLKYFEELGEDYICQVCAIERTTFYAWRNELVIYAALLAVARDVITVLD